MNQQDRYLDLDQRIEENHARLIKDKGWTRDRKSAAKIAPSLLLGMNRNESAATRADSKKQSGISLPKMTKNASAAYLDHGKSRIPKSRSSYRTTRMAGLNKSGNGLSFMGLDVN